MVLARSDPALLSFIKHGLCRHARTASFQPLHALEVAQHDAGFFMVEIADNTLIAPKAGRIQYRLTNIDEVLPAGGKVFTMLDLSYVYMDV